MRPAPAWEYTPEDSKRGWTYRFAAFHYCGEECNAGTQKDLEDLMALHVAECETKRPLTDEQVYEGIDRIHNAMAGERARREGVSVEVLLRRLEPSFAVKKAGASASKASQSIQSIEFGKGQRRSILEVVFDVTYIPSGRIGWKSRRRSDTPWGRIHLQNPRDDLTYCGRKFKSAKPGGFLTLVSVPKKLSYRQACLDPRFCIHCRTVIEKTLELEKANYYGDSP